MSRLPVLKARELLKILERLGFHKHHQSGSHIQLKHQDGRRITIPYHPSHEIRRGTLRGIISDLNMTVEEFIDLIKE